MAVGPYESGGMAVEYTATNAAIPKHRIVKFGTADKAVESAAAATDASIGVTSHLATDANASVSVWRSGIRRVVYGGTVTKGDLLTSDATGRAVATTTADDRIIGMAEISGVVDDIGSVCIGGGII